MKKANKQYSEEFKTGAVQLVQRSRSVSQTARELCISKARLPTWVKQSRELFQQMIRGSDRELNSVDVSCLLAENKSLKQALSRVEQEKAILKKAAVSSMGHCNTST